MRGAFLLAALAFACVFADGVQLDIHLVPSNSVMRATVGLAALAPHNQINFTSSSDPHITLYLTSFVEESVPKVLLAVEAVLSRQNPSCVVPLRGSSIGAGYAMWNVALSDCLQSLSDAVVEATFEFAEPNQPVPSWVYSLPPAQRDAKIAMVQKYGSPNVFSQFEPHLTIAYSTVDNLTQIYASLPSMSFASSKAAISHVGPFGTVLKGQELQNFSIGSVKSGSYFDDCRPSSTTDWDYFLLVREWPGTMTPGPVPSYINTFTLHGLWPNRNDGSWPQCCNSSYPFTYSEIAPIISDVDRVWYDTMHDQANASSFWGHEWDKHGTCWATTQPGHSGTELQYFKMCIRLHDQMTLAKWLAAAGIVPADPNSVTYQRSDFINAIQAGMGQTPLLKCTNLNGNTVIQNVGVCVNKQQQIMACPPNQVATWAHDENCGSSFGMPIIPH